ncbi:MAG: hypothetical protein AB7O84_02820 [Planctomycetota bacterium]
MLRTLTVLLSALLAAVLPAQSQEEINKFIVESKKAIELGDEKGLDKLLKSSMAMPACAVFHFTNLRAEVWGGKDDLRPQVEALNASWKRVFEGAETLDRIERWIELQDSSSWAQYRRAQGNIQRAWQFYTESTKDNTKRGPFEEARNGLMESARIMEATGNKIEAAEAWNYVAICLHKMPDRTALDIQDTIFALEQFVALRESWDYTGDQYYLINKNTLKGQKQQLEAKEAADDKRKAEGYDPDAKGIDGLVMPGAVEAECALEFDEVSEWEDVFDYSQRGGPLPVFWWNTSFGKDQQEAKLAWFRRLDLYLMRVSNSKYAVTTQPSDEKTFQPVDVSAKAKPSKFFLDAEQKVPYAMFFWQGGDREKLGEAEVNLAPSVENTPIYYRSAASWKVEVAGSELTLFDDNTSGTPMDADPFSGAFKMATIGFATDDERAKTPLLDSMKVGKGPRMPFSEFVKIGDGWHHIHKLDNGNLGTRPLNPEYLGLAKVKLVWSGPKPTAPEQLVIAGTGDFRTAFFDIASGKEVEVPAGEYRVVWGRLASGKGARLMTGTLYAADSKPFTVEAGKTTEVPMGAPFTIEFTRTGTATEVEIDAARIWLRESSGCTIGELHNMGLWPEVFVSKTADGKGAKQIDKFVKLTNADLLNKVVAKYGEISTFAGCLPVPNDSKDGDLTMKLTLPAAGMRIGLRMKKHPLFGKLDSEWK